MSAPSFIPPSDTDTDASTAWERALLDRQLAALDRLAEMGMAIAGAIERRVTGAQAEAEPLEGLHHAAIDFARVSRAVRLSFALQSRLIADFKTPPRARAAGADPDDDDDYDGPIEVVWLEPEDDPGAVKSGRVQAAVRRAAETEALDREEVERLVLRAGERLDREDFRAELLARPFHELVALICKELGLEPPLPEGASGSHSASLDLHAASP